MTAKDFTPEQIALLLDALRISRAFAVYGDGRATHQAAIQAIIDKVEDGDS